MRRIALELARWRRGLASRREGDDRSELDLAADGETDELECALSGRSQLVDLRPEKSRHPRFSVELAEVADFRKQIAPVLGTAQFPNTVGDEHGTITNPAGW